VEEITLIIAILGVVGTTIQTLYARAQAQLAKKQTLKAERANNQNNQFRKLFSEDDELLPNVSAVLNKLEEVLIEESKGGSIEIQNFGLDLETVVPWFVNKIGLNTLFSDVQLVYKALIIDPESKLIDAMIDGKSDLRRLTVSSRLEEIKKLDFFKLSKVVVEIRSYSLPPVVHGFLLNNKHLFLSFTEIENGKLKGGTFPYVYMEFNFSSRLNRHYFNMFKTWFEHIWSSSKQTYKKKY